MINPCCCTCTLYNDLFSAALDSDWEQVAGTWSTSSGAITTSDTDAMVIHATEAPGDAGRINMSATGITITPGTAEWYLIGAYKDANNYLYIKFKDMTGTGTTYELTLGYFEAGVDTVLDTDTILGNFGPLNNTEFRLCWDGTRAIGGFAIDALNGDFTPVSGGNRAGFATGAAGTSWAFPDFDFSRHKEEQGNCPTCRTCWDACRTFPATIEVYIPAGTFTSRAFAGGEDWFCNGNCENLNDQTYVLTLTDAAFRSCPQWIYTEAGFCDIENPAGAGSYPATLTVRVQEFVASDTGEIRWTIGINIASECVECPTAGYHGNSTTWSYSADDPLHPTWSPCIELEYVTSHNTFGGSPSLNCLSRKPVLTCVNASAACIVDTSKQPQIIFP
jgi:hypothetical protein